MKIYTCGFDELMMETIRWHFGRADYTDVTTRYKEINKSEADKVVVNVDKCSKEMLTVIKQYEKVNKTDKEYIYVTEDLCEQWGEDLYTKLFSAIEKASMGLSVEQYKMLSLFYIYQDLGGYICRIESDESRQIMFLDLFRPQLQKTELIIISYGDDISTEEYHYYEECGMYDRVMVGWYKDEINKRILDSLFWNQTNIDELPPLLKSLKIRLDEYTAPYKYAVFGEA